MYNIGFLTGPSILTNQEMRFIHTLFFGFVRVKKTH